MMLEFRNWALGLWLLLQASRAGLYAAGSSDYFTIEVVDSQTGRGVPLVALRTVNEAAWWTDSHGLIAFNEPGLMNLEVFFEINSPGYEYPSDVFGHHG